MANCKDCEDKQMRIDQLERLLANMSRSAERLMSRQELTTPEQIYEYNLKSVDD